MDSSEPEWIVEQKEERKRLYRIVGGEEARPYKADPKIGCLRWPDDLAIEAGHYPEWERRLVFFDRLLEEVCEPYPITTEGEVPRVRYIWPEDAFRPPLEVSERDGSVATEMSITNPLGASKEIHEEARKKGPAYQNVVEQYADAGVVEESQKPALIAVRDGLEKEMRRGWQRVQVQIGRIAELIKVWVAEATLKISDESGKGAQDKAAWLRLETLGIMMGIASGYCRLEQLPQRSLFPELAEVQEKGVRQHLKKIEPVIEEMRPIERRLFACERVLHAALRDQKVPGWDEVKGELQEQASRKRHSHKRKRTLTRRKRAVATILLLWDTDAKEYVRRPSWEEANAKDLFKTVAEQPGEEHLGGDTPANSIEDYFRRKLANEDFPTGGNMEDWFELARKWAEDVPKRLFDTR